MQINHRWIFLPTLIAIVWIGGVRAQSTTSSQAVTLDPLTPDELDCTIQAAQFKKAARKYVIENEGLRSQLAKVTQEVAELTKKCGAACNKSDTRSE